MSEFCVIGSGPAAVSAAVALTRRNLGVTMLDAGYSLDASRRELVSRLGGQSPGQWRVEDVRRLKEGVRATSKGIPLRRLYGSDYPFRECPSSFEVKAENTGLTPSFARGGLSTVWGAGLLPYRPEDLAGWPLSFADLEPYYRKVFSFVPCSACTDDLAESFPLLCNSPHQLKPSRQAEAFLADTARARDHLRRKGIVVGRSRLAVDAQGTGSGRRACEHCALCLYGCPYELIYSSEYTLRSLQGLPHFRYVAGYVVEELSENGSEVLVRGRNSETGEAREFRAGRVLLGAGVIASSAILLRSVGGFGVRIRMQDSLYFLLPVFRFKGVPDLDREKLHTLAQAFIIIQDEKLCPYRVQLSVYTFNDLMVPSLRAAGWVAGQVGDGFWQAMGARTMVCGGYLDSRLSPGIWMSVDRAASGGLKVRLEGEDSGEAKKLVQRVGLKLLMETRSFRAIPLVPFIRHSEPGRGFHTGGSFPMRLERTAYTSDVEGRPFGFERVHLVDASCFPSIPASPITLSIMANAFRIATLAAIRGA
jgi:choline dehydrogenase-like flavoprotein